MAFGFKSPEAMIALAMLNLGGYCPPGAVKIVRYRYRGAAIPTPWTQPVDSTPAGLA
jgi:hypothetical protein